MAPGPGFIHHHDTFVENFGDIFEEVFSLRFILLPSTAAARAGELTAGQTRGGASRPAPRIQPKSKRGMIIPLRNPCGFLADFS